MSDEAEQGLRAGTVSPLGIVFMVVATAAPLTAMATALPLVVGFGNGVGAPGAFLIVAGTLALFAVGYAAMSTRITNAGAFYAYVTAGMGRSAGLGAGLVATLAYNLLTIYVCGVVGFFAKQTFATEVGVDLPWWLWSAVALVIALLLGIRGVELNVRVLGVMLAVETALLVLFDVVTLVRDGAQALPAASFSPARVFDGAPAIAILFAVTCFIGFEATAIFGEEAKDPRRTVPRATYAAIAFIATLYVVTSWLVVGSAGGERAGKAAAADPGGFVFAAFDHVLGGWSVHVASWLLLTSLLAVMIAIHNMAARYLMALGRERILPPVLDRTHPTYRSPHIAGMVQAGFTAAVALCYALAGADPYLDMGSQVNGVGTLAVICLMAASSFSVPFYFVRLGEGLRPWHHVVAPVAAGALLTYFAYLIVDNYALLSGSKSALINHLYLALPIVALVGIAVGLVRRRRMPLDIVGESDAAVTERRPVA